VIHKPEMVSITGTKACSKAGLLGVISKGVQYRGVAVSTQTGDERIVFTEQTGLVRVMSIDSAYEVIDKYLETTRAPAPSPSAEVPSEERENT
jgi:hypothetical protein